MGWLCKQVDKTLNATCTECSPYCISLYDFRDILREILRTRPKTNNKAWIKLSEAILSIWRDSWEKCIWSSHPAKLLEEFPASKVHLQPATLLTGKFPSRRTNSLYFSTMILKATQVMGSYVHTLLVSWDVAIEQNSALHWEGGKGGGEQRVFWRIAHSSYSTHQIPSKTLNCLFPGNSFFPRTYYFFKISQPAKIRLKIQIFSGTDPLGALVTYTPLFPLFFSFLLQ